jgi:hypothetical protein
MMDSVENSPEKGVVVILPDSKDYLKGGFTSVSRSQENSIKMLLGIKDCKVGRL